MGGVYNLAGALWDIQTNANIYCACYGNEFFNNAGTFRKSGVRARPPSTCPLPIPARSMRWWESSVSMGVLPRWRHAGFWREQPGQLWANQCFGHCGPQRHSQCHLAQWFVPAVGNSFAVLDYGSHSGTFANITFPPGTLGQGIYGATGFSLMITNITAQTNLPVF